MHLPPKRKMDCFFLSKRECFLGMCVLRALQAVHSGPAAVGGEDGCRIPAHSSCRGLRPSSRGPRCRQTGQLFFATSPARRPLCPWHTQTCLARHPTTPEPCPLTYCDHLPLSFRQFFSYS